ncbi:hypothetical protein BESB_070830 [Besnoitia besnoiti]|uniref:Uncharacterized protein n=1 Tax=Besnoitia besnoiti TaxID=94643 RepID=A0A2A9MC86_BESBE|nr:uncharacterized protein BESB_070830 [Besnoitia besnoiti]PFH33931.1 hypothetical protein BESB_070830 [Besnoitia besnoiti]
MTLVRFRTRGAARAVFPPFSSFPFLSSPPSFCSLLSPAPAFCSPPVSLPESRAGSPLAIWRSVPGPTLRGQRVLPLCAEKATQAFDGGNSLVSTPHRSASASRRRARRPSRFTLRPEDGRADSDERQAFALEVAGACARHAGTRARHVIVLSAGRRARERLSPPGRVELSAAPSPRSLCREAPWDEPKGFFASLRSGRASLVCGQRRSISSLLHSRPVDASASATPDPPRDSSPLCSSATPEGGCSILETQGSERESYPCAWRPEENERDEGGRRGLHAPRASTGGRADGGRGLASGREASGDQRHTPAGDSTERRRREREETHLQTGNRPALCCRPPSDGQPTADLEALLASSKAVALWLNAVAGELERLQRRLLKKEAGRPASVASPGDSGGLWALVCRAAETTCASCEKKQTLAERKRQLPAQHEATETRAPPLGKTAATPAHAPRPSCPSRAAAASPVRPLALATNLPSGVPPPLPSPSPASQHAAVSPFGSSSAWPPSNFWVWAVRLLCRRQREEREAARHAPEVLVGTPPSSSFSSASSPRVSSRSASASPLHSSVPSCEPSVSSSECSAASSAPPPPVVGDASPALELRGLATAANACVRLYKLGRENPGLTSSLFSSGPPARTAPPAASGAPAPLAGVSGADERGQALAPRLAAASSSVSPVASSCGVTGRAPQSPCDAQETGEAHKAPATGRRLVVVGRASALDLPSSSELRDCLLTMLFSVENWEEASRRMNEQDASLLVNACATAEVLFPPLFSALKRRLSQSSQAVERGRPLPQEEEAQRGRRCARAGDCLPPALSSSTSSLFSSASSSSEFSFPSRCGDSPSARGDSKGGAGGAEDLAVPRRGAGEGDFLSSFSPQGLSLLLHGFASLSVSLSPTLGARLACAALDKLHATRREETACQQSANATFGGRGSLERAHGLRDAKFGHRKQAFEGEYEEADSTETRGDAASSVSGKQAQQPADAAVEGRPGDSTQTRDQRRVVQVRSSGPLVAGEKKEERRGGDEGAQERGKREETSWVCTPEQAVRLVYALAELPAVPRPMARQAAAVLAQGRLKSSPEAFTIQGRLLALRSWIALEVDARQSVQAILVSLLRPASSFISASPRSPSGFSLASSSGTDSRSVVSAAASKPPTLLRFSEQHFALLLHLLATAQATGALEGVASSSPSRTMQAPSSRPPLEAEAHSRPPARAEGHDDEVCPGLAGCTEGTSVLALLPGFLQTHLPPFLAAATPQGLANVFAALAKLDAGSVRVRLPQPTKGAPGGQLPPGPAGPRGRNREIVYADILLAQTCARQLLSRRTEPRHVIACCFAAASSFAGTPQWHAALLFHAFYISLVSRPSSFTVRVSREPDGHGCWEDSAGDPRFSRGSRCTPLATLAASLGRQSLYDTFILFAGFARDSTGVRKRESQMSSPSGTWNAPSLGASPEKAEKSQEDCVRVHELPRQLTRFSGRQRHQGTAEEMEAHVRHEALEQRELEQAPAAVEMAPNCSTESAMGGTAGSPAHALSACGVTVQTASQLQAVLLHLALEWGDLGGLAALDARVLRASLWLVDCFAHSSLDHDSVQEKGVPDYERRDALSNRPLSGDELNKPAEWGFAGGSRTKRELEFEGASIEREPVYGQSAGRDNWNSHEAARRSESYWEHGLPPQVKSSHLHSEVLNCVRTLLGVHSRCGGLSKKTPPAKPGPRPDAYVVVSEALVPPYIIDIAVHRLARS